MKKLLFVLLVAIIVIFIFVVNQVIVLRKAHSTFENYYAFRGCTELVKKTDTYGFCKTSAGKIIKIVEFNGRWYLDGDLPVCYFHICI